METPKTVALSGGAIEYNETGSGRPVVFVHGILADNELWRPMAAEFGDSVRCIFPRWPLGLHDRPFTDSADMTAEGLAKTIAEFIEALELRDVVLIANDSGGALSQIVCANHPERIGALVLTNCDALEVFPPRAFSHIVWAAKIPGGYTLMAHMVRWFGWLRNSALGWGALTETPRRSLWKRWARMFATKRRSRTDLVRFAKTVSNRSTLAAAEALVDFEAPVLLLWGENDRYFKPSLAERLAQKLPNARVELVADAKTFVALDQPVVCARAIERFLTENTRANRAAS